MHIYAWQKTLQWPSIGTKCDYTVAICASGSSLCLGIKVPQALQKQYASSACTLQHIWGRYTAGARQNAAKHVQKYLDPSLTDALHIAGYVYCEERLLYHLSGSVLKRSVGIPAGQRMGRSSSNSAETGRALKQCTGRTNESVMDSLQC